MTAHIHTTKQAEGSRWHFLLLWGTGQLTPIKIYAWGSPSKCQQQRVRRDFSSYKHIVPVRDAKHGSLHGNLWICRDAVAYSSQSADHWEGEDLWHRDSAEGLAQPSGERTSRWKIPPHSLSLSCIILPLIQISLF